MLMQWKKKGNNHKIVKSICQCIIRDFPNNDITLGTNIELSNALQPYKF